MRQKTQKCINGKFWDRISDDIEQIKKAFPTAAIKQIKDIKHPICGISQEVYLETAEIGDIFYTSWGYDETHYDFIKILGFTKSGKSAICRRVYAESVEGGNLVYDSIKPTTKTFGPTFKLLIRNRTEYTVLRGRYPRGIAQNTYMSSEPESFFKCEDYHKYMETNPQFGH